MKKLLTIAVIALSVWFGGCSSKSAAADAPTQSSVALPGDKESIATYYIGAYMDAKAAKSALEGAGFEVIGEHKMKKIGTTLVYTNDALKKMADKPTRGFAAIQRLFIDEERQQISLTNPVYFGKAFMQDQYDHATSKAASDALHKAFSGLTPSKDAMEFGDLEGYHFMMGMPYYTDVDELGEGDTAALVDQIVNGKKAKKNLVFELKLSDDRVLVGYKLSKRTAKFPTKIGTQNSGLLPYTVLIEDGKAVSLAAKYYLAISYPLLTMGEFMTIATVPGAIEKDLAKPFK
jgi:hypothetical protein